MRRRARSRKAPDASSLQRREKAGPFRPFFVCGGRRAGETRHAETRRPASLRRGRARTEASLRGRPSVFRCGRDRRQGASRRDFSARSAGKGKKDGYAGERIAAVGSRDRGAAELRGRNVFFGREKERSPARSLLQTAGKNVLRCGKGLKKGKTPRAFHARQGGVRAFVSVPGNLMQAERAGNGAQLRDLLGAAAQVPGNLPCVRPLPQKGGVSMRAGFAGAVHGLFPPELPVLCPPRPCSLPAGAGDCGVGGTRRLDRAGKIVYFDIELK